MNNARRSRQSIVGPQMPKDRSRLASPAAVSATRINGSPGWWDLVPPMLARDHVPDLTFAFGTQVFKYLIFNNPNWDYSTYDFSNFENDTRLAASFLNATNPDLQKFKARHGKLVIWHGWADPALPALATTDYYRQVLAHDARAPEYCRLFMIPGCMHCGGGPGAADVDWLSVI